MTNNASRTAFEERSSFGEEAALPQKTTHKTRPNPALCQLKLAAIGSLSGGRLMHADSGVVLMIRMMRGVRRIHGLLDLAVQHPLQILAVLLFAGQLQGLHFLHENLRAVRQLRVDQLSLLQQDLQLFLLDGMRQLVAHALLEPWRRESFGNLS